MLDRLSKLLNRLGYLLLLHRLTLLLKCDNWLLLLNWFLSHILLLLNHWHNLLKLLRLLLDRLLDHHSDRLLGHDLLNGLLLSESQRNSSARPLLTIARIGSHHLAKLHREVFSF